MKPRIFGVDYQFLSCGDVFTQGLVHAAEDLGIPYAHAGWDAPYLEQHIADFSPTLIFVVHGRRFAQRFQNVHQLGPPVAVWLVDEPYEVDETSQWASRFDRVFVNDPATLHRHPGSVYLPVCYNPHVHQSAPLYKAHAVGFIGGGNSVRERVLGELARAGKLSYVVGGPWADHAVAARCLSLNISPDMTAALYRQTQIVVNVFREVHHWNFTHIEATALNPRVYEALACGALVVSEWRAELDTLVPDLPTFRTPEECVEVVGLLLDHPDVAENIRATCAALLAEHTYAARLRTVLVEMGVEVAA